MKHICVQIFFPFDFVACSSITHCQCYWTAARSVVMNKQSFLEIDDVMWTSLLVYPAHFVLNVFWVCEALQL